MSGQEALSKSLNVNREYWLDLEVPFEIIQDKWDQRYESELRYNIEHGRINKRVLDIYFKLLAEPIPAEKSEALDALLEENQAWGYNLLSQYQFSLQKSANIVSEVGRKIYYDVENTRFHELYTESQGADDKIAIIALLQLFRPDSLRNILGLDYCYGKKPSSISEDGDLSDLNPNDEIDTIIEKMSENDYRDYEFWHSFEHQGKHHIMIKRQIDDDVERQTDENLEEEPAEFVVLKFVNDQLEIISRTKTIAEKARTGVSRATDLEIDPVDASISRDDLESSMEELFTIDDESEINFVGINIASTPLPGHPSLRMKSSDGVKQAIDALKERGFDLTENIDDIEVIKIEFNDRDYSLRPEAKISDDEVNWVITYDARYLRDGERREFEESINNLLGIDVLFESK